eukprot:4954539-Karenia_brevis.AAC.1
MPAPPGAMLPAALGVAQVGQWTLTAIDPLATGMARLGPGSYKEAVLQDSVTLLNGPEYFHVRQLHLDALHGD